MGLIRAFFKGVSALVFVMMLALSFAPMTDNEIAVLGETAPRMTIMQRRIAIGVLEADKYGLLDLINAEDRPNDAFVVRWGLQNIVDGRNGAQGNFVTQPTSIQDTGTGARFVTVN